MTMNPEQNRRQCTVCVESEPSFIHTVWNDNVFRQLCTDCLLNEHRDLYCAVCLKVFAAIPSTHDCIICLKCPASPGIVHISCSRPPSSSSARPSASWFSCPHCSDPNFSFFPKRRVSGSGTPIDMKSAKALVLAAKITMDSLIKAVRHLSEEGDKKILQANMAKRRAKGALQNLQDLVIRQIASEDINSHKRNNSMR